MVKRTISGKILKGRADEITRSCKYDGFQRTLASMFYKCVDIKNSIRSECKWRTSWRII